MFINFKMENKNSQIEYYWIDKMNQLNLLIRVSQITWTNFEVILKTTMSCRRICTVCALISTFLQFHKVIYIYLKEICEKIKYRSFLRCLSKSQVSPLFMLSIIWAYLFIFACACGIILFQTRNQNWSWQWK